MAASKKTFPFSRFRSARNRKHDSRKLSFKSSVENSSSIRNRHYPAYLTVDDLATHRRRRFLDRIQRDNLRPLSGKFAHLKSEYRRRFKSFILAVDDSGATVVRNWGEKKQDKKQQEENVTSGEEEKKQDPTTANSEDDTSPKSPAEPEADVPTLCSEHQRDERSPSFMMFREARRAALVRRPTNLKVEGDFVDVTESRDQFKEPVKTQRAAIVRRATTLKLEGDMNLSTELRDKYKKYENVESQRSTTTLMRRYSNLRTASGSIDSLTEYDSSYATPALSQRPPLARSMENLHVEGNIDFDPEYKRNFVDYHAHYPDIIFKGRKMDTRPEYLAYKSNPLKYSHIKDVLLDESLKNDFSPEYRRAYVPMELPQRSNFKRPRTHLTPAFGIGEKESELNAKYKPFLNVEKTKNLRPSTHLRAEGKAEFRPEYKSAFVDFVECRTRAECEPEQSFSVLQTDANKHSNRSADARFKKGKRLPSGKADPAVSNSKMAVGSQKPSFRLEVTNPDQIRKPFERMRVDDTAAFVVLEDNNNHRRSNNWVQSKQNQQRWSPSWKKN